MASWSQVEYGLDSANETINFGTRTLAEGDALYETTTLAVVSTDSKVTKNPSVKSLNQSGQLFLAIDNTFRVFSKNCMHLDLFTSVDSQIDSFEVSTDNNLVVLCLNDGNVHCLYIPTGGRLVCSAFVPDTIIGNLFSSVRSIKANNDTSTFIICTTKGKIYRLEIEHVNEVYMQLNNNEENLNANYSFELVETVSNNSLISNIKYQHNTVYISHIYKRYFAENGSCIIALDSNGSMIGICKVTNDLFDIWNEDVLQDFILLQSLNMSNHRLLVLTPCETDDCLYIKLLSYPEFETIYQLKVSENTFLVQSTSDEDEVIFIEGFCGHEYEFITELRLKQITESIPQVKLDRMLRRKSFDEAEKFARVFGLSIQPVYKARAEELLPCDNMSLNSAELIERWAIFSRADQLEEMLNYLRNGRINKCSLMFNRLDYNTKKEIDIDIITSMLKLVPYQASLKDLLPLVRNILAHCIESLPDSMSVVIDWLYKCMLRCEITKEHQWPECAIEFSTHILIFLQKYETQYLVFQKHCLISESLEKFRNVIHALGELLVLKQDYGIKISLNEYLQEPDIVMHLLLLKVKVDQIPEFINHVILKYVQNNKLDFDKIVAEFIRVIIETQKWWEEVVAGLIPFIYANTIRMKTVLVVLKNADVPWSNTICQLAQNGMNEEHPLSGEIKKLEENTAVKLLVKKYSIQGVTDFDNEDLVFIIRRMLLVSKMELFEDLEIVMLCNPQLREECTVLCLYHFIKNGRIEEALKYLKYLDQYVLIHCCKAVLLSAEYFLFCKNQFSELITHHIEVLNSIERRLQDLLSPSEFLVYQKAIHNLKSIFVLKTKYDCTEISHIAYDLTSLLPALVKHILSEIQQSKISWAEGTYQCEKLSYLTGVTKEQYLYELVQQSDNLTGLVHAAKAMLLYDSSCLDMCSMAIIIMKRLNNTESNSLSPRIGKTEFLRTDERIIKNTAVIELLQLANVLAVQAYVKANQLEKQSACEILHWCNSCFWLRNETADIPVGWRFTPLFHPETICFHSERTLGIMKELFETFLQCAGTRIILPKYNTVIKSTNNSEIQQILQSIDTLPEKIHHLQIEGYDLTALQLITYFKMMLSIMSANSNISIDVKQKIGINLVTRCISSLLHKIFISKIIDQPLAFSLFMTREFHPLKWIPSALKMYKTDVKKINAVATLGCLYMNLRGEQYGAYLNLKNRCDWWNKFLHCCVPYNDLFQLNPDEIVKKYLLKSNKLNMKILNEFCSNFSLNLQTFLPLYLRSILLKWQPKIGLETLVTPEAEIELFLTCKEVISYMDNIATAVIELNTAWEQISYYQYEVYLCILDLLKDFDKKCTNSDKRHLIMFLKSYKRIGKPQQKEREEWQTKFPFSQKMDPLSKYRLPYLSAMFTKDVWEIIRPEINLHTYERWFEASSMLQLDKDDICTYAIKGTIHSGVLKSDDTKWSIRSKHDSLLANMEKCVSQINKLNVATAVLYQAVYSVSGGVDQVTIAEMCWKKANEWKMSVSNSDSIIEVWTKVKRKYFTCQSTHLLYMHNLGIDKYLTLVGQTEQLIKALYFDESIIERTSNLSLHYPDINQTVDELAELHSIDIIKLRTALVMECLQESSEDIHFDYTMQQTEFARTLDQVPTGTENTNQDNLKRAIYICQSADQEIWKDLLFNISFSRLDDTMTMIITAPNLLMRVKALHCFLAISAPEDLKESTGQTATELSLYLEKLQILSILEVLGYALTVEELDYYNKTDLMWKILQTQSLDERAIRAVAKLSALYDIWIPSIWNKILLGFVHLLMIRELEEWLPKLHKCCYTPGIDCSYVSGWQCLVTNYFLKLPSDQDNYIQGFLILQSCPIISKLDKCLLHIFYSYLNNEQYDVCAMFIPYVPQECFKEEMIKALQPYKTKQLYEKIQDLSVYGIINTEYAVGILSNST
ncbi:rough deal [Carabus blaptoides fortunei]